MKMKVSLTICVLIVLAFGSISLYAQTPDLGMSLVPARGLPRLSGRAVTDNSSAPNSINATPHWSSGFHGNSETGLEAQSAVYDQLTNTMIVFGGLASGLAFNDSNAVLLNAPATGSGVWTTLIANGTAGSPLARDSHTAVYDSASDRMIVFAGQVFSTGEGLNDVWVLSSANGQGGTPT